MQAHIIAHKDFDGVVSSLCFSLADKADVGSVTFIEIYNVASFLKENRHALKDKCLQFVDLAMFPEDIELIEEITQDYFILDHHETTQKLTDNPHIHFRDTWVTETLNTILSTKELALLEPWEPISCAVLCHCYSSYREQNGHITGNLDKLVQHSRIVDTVLYSKIGSKDSLKFAKLCDKYGAAAYYELLLKRLTSYEPLITPDEEAYVFELSIQHEMEKRRIQENGVSVDMRGLHILVFESAGELSEIAEDLSQDFNLCIGLNRAEGGVILRTRNKNLGLGNIAQQFSWGGHSTSAGFRYSELSSLTVAQLIEMIIDSNLFV